MKTINEEWESLAEAIFPEGVSDIQRHEMRRAFFCGAEMMRCKMLHLADDTVSENAAMALIDAFDDEIKLFKLQLLKGEA